MRATIFRVILSQDEADALQTAANVQLRHPRDQARLFLRDAMERAGLLPELKTANGPEPRTAVTA